MQSQSHICQNSTLANNEKQVDKTKKHKIFFAI